MKRIEGLQQIWITESPHELRPFPILLSLSLSFRDLLQPPDRNPQTAAETTNRKRMSLEWVAAPAATLL
jgi:hypothetical protein